MAELAKLMATVAHLEQMVDDDDGCDKMHETFATNARLQLRVEEALRRAHMRLRCPGTIAFSFATTGLELSIAHIGCQLGLWESLVKQSPAAVEAGALAAAAGMSGALMLRLLRYGAAHDMVKQVSRTTFRASRGTERLATPGVKNAAFLSYGIRVAHGCDYLSVLIWSVTGSICSLQ